MHRGNSVLIFDRKEWGQACCETAVSSDKSVNLFWLDDFGESIMSSSNSFGGLIWLNASFGCFLACIHAVQRIDGHSCGRVAIAVSFEYC